MKQVVRTKRMLLVVPTMCVFTNTVNVKVREGSMKLNVKQTTRLFHFNVTVKIREGSVKDSEKGFREVPNLVPLADLSSAVHNFTDKVGIHLRGIQKLCR